MQHPVKISLMTHLSTGGHEESVITWHGSRGHTRLAVAELVEGQNSELVADTLP